MKDVKQDLFDRMSLLDLRHNVAFGLYGGDDMLGDQMYLYIAKELETELHDKDRQAAAAERIRAIVDPADLSSATFWKTPLGVLLFIAGGFKDAELPQALAASLLGCSRQYVSEMVKNGKLARSPHGVRSQMVSTEAVRELLICKLDRFVN